jgi:hypothetical protein
VIEIMRGISELPIIVAALVTEPVHVLASKVGRYVSLNGIIYHASLRTALIHHAVFVFLIMF